MPHRVSVSAGLLALALVVGCGSDSSSPVVALVHPALGGGSLLGGWAASATEVIFVGGAEPDAKVCFQGSRELLDYDGVDWRFLRTDPTNVDGGTSSDGGTDGGVPVDASVPSPDTGKPDAGTIPDGGSPDLAPCTPKGPLSGPLRGVYGFSSQEFYTVGEAGAILRIRPDSVEQMNIGDDTKPNFNAIWGSSINDMWAVGGLPQGTTAMMTAALPRIYHFDGSSWTKSSDALTTSGALIAIWGASADDVWTVGENGQILHFDGRSWTAQQAIVTEPIVSVTGTDHNHVYAVGGDTRPVVLAFDGIAWKEIQSKTHLPEPKLLAILPLGNDQFVVTGQHGLFAVGTLDSLVPSTELPMFLNNSPAGPQTSLHVLVPYFVSGFMVAGGNLFDTQRMELHATVLSIGATISGTFAPPSGVTGGFQTAPPPASVNGGTIGSGW